MDIPFFTYWLCTTTSLHLIITLITLMGPVLSLLCEVYGKISMRSFWTKLSRHLSAMSTISLAIFIITTVAGYFIIIPGTPFDPLYPKSLSGSLFLLLAVLAGWSLIWWITHSLTWDRLKKNKGLHIFFGVLKTAGLLGLTFCVLGIFSGMAVTPVTELPLKAGQALAWPIQSLFWPLLTHTVVLGMGLTGAFAPLFLILRRSRDDFGRDYYNWAMSTSSKWALVFLLAQLILIPWYVALKPLHQNVPAIVTVLFLGGLIVSSFFWIILSTSKNSLRLKGLSLLAILSSWAFTAGLIIFLFNKVLILPQ